MPGIKKFLSVLLLLAAVFIVSGNTAAQGTGIVRGFVTDSTNGEALAFGNVYINGLNTGTSTNAKGYYLLTSIPAGKYRITYSYVGYQTKTIYVFVVRNKTTVVDVSLSPAAISLPAVEAIGYTHGKGNSTDISLDKISMRQLEKIPMGVESDVFRSLQYLPGVQSAGDVSAKFYVRGGANDQNLILLDGSVLYSPFHALGIFSVVDPDMVNSVEFYKGGFPAEYGGRLSSVLRIITKDGNRNTYGAKASASLLSGKLLVEGPIPNGSFIVTGRKSYSNQILKKFMNDKNVPVDFYDLSFKMNYTNDEYIKNGRLTLHGFFSGDRITNSEMFTSNYNWSNNIIGLNYYQVSDTPLYYEFSIYISNFKGDVTPNNSNARPQSNEVKDFTMKYDFTYVYDSKDEMSVGIKLKDISTNLYLANSFGAISNVGSHGASFSAYGKYKFLRFEHFGADVGTRINLIRLADENRAGITLAPRVSLTYRFSPLIALKGAWGVYQQEITTLSDENQVLSIFDPWIISPAYLDRAKASHYIAGFKIDPSPNITINLEGYYKKIINLPILNDKRYFETDHELVPGTGESYGLNFDFNFHNDPFDFSVSYSLGWVFTTVNGIRYAPRYDSKHTVNLLLNYNIGDGWEASAAWTFHSGTPFTQIRGFYDKYYFSDQSGANSLYQSFLPYTILAGKNTARLPSYHRLDLSVSKKFKVFGINTLFDMNILNVYNRANIFYFDRSTGARVNMLPFLPTATLKVEI